MNTLTDLISSGRIIDLILLLVAGEAVVLFTVNRVLGRGPAPSRLIANLAAGSSLLLATKAALLDAGVGVIAGLLFLSFIAHIWDLVQRI